MSTTADSPMESRPGFLAQLGLLPPYTVDDVRQAYLELAKKTHPDAGGSADEFSRVQQAYEQALEFVEFRSDRRKWVAAHMDEYLGVQRVRSELEAMGAQVTLHAIDWLNDSFGDFAQLTETVREICLLNSARADEAIACMVRESHTLRRVRGMNLSGSRISKPRLWDLRFFPQLEHLDLSHTNAGAEVLELAGRLPKLDCLELEGTRVGWWTRRRIARLFARRRKKRSRLPRLPQP